MKGATLFCLWILKVRSEREKQRLEPYHSDTCNVSEECKPCDASCIPHEGNLFDTHSDHAGSGADDQQASADAGAEGQQMPEKAVLYEESGIGRI